MNTREAALSSVMSTVCSIRGIQSKHDIGGHGVFIRPNLVLTCWHVVSGNRELVFFNGDGEEATMVRGSRFNRKMKEHDIATVHISRPLGTTPLKLARTGDYMHDNRGAVATRFGGKPGVYDAGVYEDDITKLLRNGISDLFTGTVLEGFSYKLKDVYKDAVHGATAGGLQTYVAEKEMRPGYSGSPVFDSRGRLASVVSAIPAGNPQGSKIFFGPAPEKVASFLTSVLG